MAISAQNVTYQGNGPTASSQILAANLSAPSDQNLVGSATFTLDGSATSATLNFIDGTAALPFTPTAVLCNVTGGNQGATAFVSAIADAPANGVSTTVRFSAAGTNAKTLQVSFLIIK